LEVGKEEKRVKNLFSHLKVNQHSFYRTKKLFIAIKLKNEYLILATNINQDYALRFYKKDGK